MPYDRDIDPISCCDFGSHETDLQMHKQEFPELSEEFEAGLNSKLD